MNRLSQLAVAGLLLACGIPASAQQAPPVVTLDENGNGTIQAPDGSQAAVKSGLTSDPFVPSGQANVLTYFLPFNTSPGDVRLIEPSATGVQDVSDVLRFTGNNTVLFYSDVSANDPADSLADIGLPASNTQLQLATIREVGPEGDNGAAYSPGPGLPGFSGNPDGSFMSYRIISDSPVPEASTTLSLGLLLALGLGGLVVARRKAATRD